MKALIIGATGATGKELVNILLQDPYYTEVIIFVRRLSGVARPKLSEVLTDFDRLEKVGEFIKGDILFSCLGTTLKAAGSKDKQWQVDFEIPFQFAEIARKNEVGKVVLLSAYGASASSKVFYSQIKGKLEEAMDRLHYNQFIIFRPGILQRKDTDRIGESISIAVIKILNSVGIIRKFRPLPTSILSEKMAKAPKVLAAGKHEIQLEKIFAF